MLQCEQLCVPTSGSGFYQWVWILPVGLEFASGSGMQVGLDMKSLLYHVIYTQPLHKCKDLKLFYVCNRIAHLNGLFKIWTSPQEGSPISEGGREPAQKGCTSILEGVKSFRILMNMTKLHVHRRWCNSNVSQYWEFPVGK